jgi:DNA polymerase I-like protein with 3'-5' exonuclease and polymerase domains
MNPIYRLAPITQLTTYLDSKQELFTDAETKGFDPYTKPLISLQVGDFDTQYIIDCETVNIKQFKVQLESKLLLLQNGKFDLKFLYHQGIYPRKIYDTFVAEKVLTCGLDFARAALDVLTEKYAGATLDKSVRVDIPKEGLSPRVISYAADDIKYLGIIRDAQMKLAAQQDLVAVINLENRFTPCLAYIEYCGFKLDENKWKAKMESDLALMQGFEKQLNEWVLNLGDKKYIQQQLNMFEEQTCTINWSSPGQVVKFFESLGMDCTVVEKGVAKKSVEAKAIKKYADDYEIVKIYLEYKQAEKVVTTYGDSFLQQINPVTGRIHTNFKQVLDTGRISSGGKDKDKKINLINFQNIPADPDTRACFVAEPGNTLIICDYSGQEQIVLANYSLDPGILKFYDQGLGDMHSYVASLIFPELQGLTLDEVKVKHKDKRQIAKTAGFSINYGGVGATIAANQGISKEEGDRVYEAYFKAFPGLNTYFTKARKQGLEDGYIFISPITKRKSYIPFYDKYTELANQITPKFWSDYRESKQRNGPDFPAKKKIVKDYFYYKGEIERKSLNFPIQGSSAEITKISCMYIFDYIVEHNLFGIVKFANTIHDENVVEAPLEIAPQVAEVVGSSMVRAGKFFCKRVPLLAEPELSTYWKK